MDQVVNKLDYDTNEWVVTGVASACAIYGLDQAPWAYTPNFPELKTYDFEIEEMDGSTKSVSVNEIDCAIQAGEGKKNPTEAGLRMDNTQYMLTYFDEDTGVAQLARRGGGGAAICKTTTGVIIALFEKEGVDSNGKS